MSTRPREIRLAATAATLLLLIAGAARAGDPVPSPRKTVPGLPAITPEQDLFSGIKLPNGVRVDETSTGDPDEDAALAVVRDVKSKGILSVREHLAALQKVLDHMPRPFNRVEAIAGQIRYRSDSMDDCVAFATTLGSDGASGTKELICGGNPFPTAGFYLGAYFNEIGQPEQAIPALTAGLAAAPNSPVLISELSASHISLHRWADALADNDRGLAIENLADEDRARLYRGRGYALTELERLDEAEAAYHASLALMPENQLAKNELIYIARLRAGAKPSPSGTLIPLQPANPK